MKLYSEVICKAHLYGKHQIAHKGRRVHQSKRQLKTIKAVHSWENVKAHSKTTWVSFCPFFFSASFSSLPNLLCLPHLPRLFLMWSHCVPLVCSAQESQHLSRGSFESKTNNTQTLVISDLFYFYYKSKDLWHCYINVGETYFLCKSYKWQML